MSGRLQTLVGVGSWDVLGACSEFAAQGKLMEEHVDTALGEIREGDLEHGETSSPLQRLRRLKPTLQKRRWIGSADLRHNPVN